MCDTLSYKQHEKGEGNMREKKLGYALQQLEDNLLTMGIDNHIGHDSGMGTYVRLSERGATNLLALVTALQGK
jgi:hypothetical protein